MAQNKRITWQLALTTIALSSVMGLVLLEIAVRLTRPYYTPEIAQHHAIPYELRAYGSYLIQGADRLIDVDSRKAWGAPQDDVSSSHNIFISQNGYRGPSFEPRKPPGVYRIIVVGGSAVFDQGATDTPDNYLNTWPHRVQMLLAEGGFGHVEVINAGVPGQTSADSLGRIFSQLWLYEPNMLVVYHGWNDFKFWHRIAVTPDTPLIDRALPFDPKADPFLNYQGRLDRMLSYSQLYIRLRTMYFRWKWNPSYEGAVPASIEVADTFGPYGPEQHRINLTLVVRAAEAMGAIPVIIKQATLVDLDNTADDLASIGYDYMSLEHAAIHRAFQESYRIIDEIGNETSAIIIDPTAINGTSEFFSDHVHTTREGSEALAQIVAQQLIASQAPFATTSQEDVARINR